MFEYNLKLESIISQETKKVRRNIKHAYQRVDGIKYINKITVTLVECMSLAITILSNNRYFDIYASFYYA